jgi:hypothetical protein
MATNDVVLLGPRAEGPWFHAKVHTTGTFDGQHRLRSVAIELAVDPGNGFDGRRLAQFTASESLVDRALDANMRGGLTLEIAAPPVCVQVLGQGPLDVAWPGHMPLNQVAVVAIGETEQVGKTSGCGRMKLPIQTRRPPDEVRHQVSQLIRNGFQLTRFYALRTLHRQLPIIMIGNYREHQ